MGRPRKELAGQRFGQLTVISPVDSDRYGVRWLCQCTCGKATILHATSLLSTQQVRSCGCLKEQAGKTHGYSSTRTYRAWRYMKNRCLNPNRKDFPFYGGRGITICERWVQRFEHFLSDMGECPAGMTLDRIDSRQGYAPENCRWIPAREQPKNTRQNRYIEAYGKRQIVADWEAELGISRFTLYNRLRRGLTGEAALQPPTK